jgi:hypothetical protein
MEQSELLRFAITALERLAVPYLITGSTATIAFGEPRFTNDFDIEIDLHDIWDAVLARIKMA